MAERWDLSRARRLLGGEWALLAATVAVFAPWCWRALAERWRASGAAQFPGHADPAFYFSLSENIAAGRGPVIDYIWHFWVPHSDLTHFGPDYWLPLPAYLMALGVKLGGGLPGALRVVVATSVALAASVWLFARSLGLPRWAALAASALVFLALPVARFSVEADSSLFYSALVLCSLAVCVLARRSATWWPTAAAGFLAGCAHLCRNDAIVVLVSAVAAQIAWRLPDAGRRIVWLVAGQCAALLPFAFALYRATGRVMPAHGALPFLVDYEDLYAMPPGPGLASMLHAGVEQALLLRQRATLDRTSDYVRDLLGVPALLLVLGTGVAVGARATRPGPHGGWLGIRETSWLAPGMYTAALFVLHTVVTPVASAAGAFSRSLPAVVAILLAATLAGLARLRVGGLLSLVLVAGLIGWPWHERAKGASQRVVRDNDLVAERMAAVRGVLGEDSRCLPRPVVVMTRDPWELTALTGYRSVQIPNADAETVLATARRYGVTHLVSSPRRRSLASPLIAEAFTPVPGHPELLRATSLALKCR